MIATSTQDLAFVDSDAPLDGVDLGTFLKNFSVLHNTIVKLGESGDDVAVHLLSVPPSDTMSVWLENPEWHQKLAKEYFIEHGKHNGLTDIDYNPNNIIISEIDKHSPLEIVCCCVIGALTLAVIISGGNVEIKPSGIKFQIPPIGEGIASIRKAMRSGNQRSPQSPSPF